MRSLLASVAFCTRIPVRSAFTSDEVGKAAYWFPVIGGLLGLFSIGISRLLLPHFPAFVVTVLILVADVLLTGALHVDGLADMADGFGGGKTREDVLRIMRDSVIGSYGSTALILMFSLKATTVSALLVRGFYSPFLLLAPVIGRWSIVFLSRCFPYARSSDAVACHIGTRELIWATVFTVAMIVGTTRWRGVLSWSVATIVAVLFGVYCRRKIGGVTGDTLGAAEQIVECLILLVGAATV